MSDALVLFVVTPATLCTFHCQVTVVVEVVDQRTFKFIGTGCQLYNSLPLCKTFRCQH